MVAGTQHPGPHRGFQPQLLAPEVPGGVTAGPGPVQAAGHVAERGQVGLEGGVVGRAGRGDRVSRRPPALAPGEHQPGAAGTQGGPLRECREFGPVRGGLCPQFRGAQCDLVLVEDGQAAPAGGEQPAPVARGAGAECLGEPALRPGQRGHPAVPVARRRAQVGVGLRRAAKRARQLPGQQACLGRITGAQQVQVGRDLPGLAQQPGGR